MAHWKFNIKCYWELFPFDQKKKKNCGLSIMVRKVLVLVHTRTPFDKIDIHHCVCNYLVFPLHLLSSPQRSDWPSWQCWRLYAACLSMSISDYRNKIFQVLTFHEMLIKTTNCMTGMTINWQSYILSFIWKNLSYSEKKESTRCNHYYYLFGRFIWFCEILIHGFNSCLKSNKVWYLGY